MNILHCKRKKKGIKDKGQNPGHAFSKIAEKSTISMRLLFIE